MNKFTILLGDFYHPAPNLQASLEKLYLNNSQIQLNFVNIEAINESLLNQTDLLIIGRENRINPKDKILQYWMDEQKANDITQFVQNGGSMLVCHSGLSSYEQNDQYIQLVKGYFKFHPKVQQIVNYHNNNQDHDSFSFLDEHYFVSVDEQNTEIFLTSTSVDGESIAGWRHTYGKGKVCCITPAHHKEALLHHDMLKLLEHCTNWCLE
ncbi:ThuA domain-containing protein [Chengkuizengella axinellae]|uniref:ThuA domain-containing protein n=1 Tax=Chengkuizengella axinellae TaxID=3064388 RepID=A0ABT9J4H7_9BACL|nr:ThuA domain-containing protein [Chengkuizengella sp. 2205SS18-9]MDP5276517.1 ThuA domain-containing protein [Chengkuizengella sp. 2205SS18-9]